MHDRWKLPLRLSTYPVSTYLSSPVASGFRPARSDPPKLSLEWQKQHPDKCFCQNKLESMKADRFIVSAWAAADRWAGHPAICLVPSGSRPPPPPDTEKTSCSVGLLSWLARKLMTLCTGLITALLSLYKERLAFLVVW